MIIFEYLYLDPNRFNGGSQWIKIQLKMSPKTARALIDGIFHSQYISLSAETELKEEAVRKKRKQGRIAGASKLEAMTTDPNSGRSCLYAGVLEHTLFQDL